MAKKCVLLIGNGFSCGLIEYFGLQQNIDLVNLLPPPDWMREKVIPMSGSNLKKGLWDESRYPELHRLYNQLVLAGTSQKEMFWRICQALTDQPAFSIEGKSISYVNFTAPVQFRCYLWNLFREYSLYFQSNCQHPPIDNYPLFSVLHTLARLYELTVVSYNYDFWAESLFWWIEKQRQCRVKCPAVECVHALQRRAIRDVVFLKPHGCISHQSPFGGSEAGEVYVVNCISLGSGADYNLRSCPSIPDIVPPGHSASHLADAATDIAEATRIAFQHADCLVVCGFSATGPDADELEMLLQRARRVRVVHVGLWKNKDDCNTNAATLLKKYASQYYFVDSSSVAIIPSLLCV